MTGEKNNRKEGESSGSEYGLDHNSPYYIHASDYPRQMHVNEVLTDGNHLDWSTEMLNFLFAKNKVGFIDGSIKKPEPNTADYMAWMRCDAMIKGWLNIAMEKEIRASVKYASTAREIWEDLKERFGKGNAPSAYELKQSLSTIKQEGLSVSAYYTKLRGLWDEIHSVSPTPTCKCSGCVCDIGKKLGEQRDKEKLYEFLLGLDAEFGIIRTQILAMRPTPTLGSAYHLVADDEQQRSVAGNKRVTVEALAFQAFVPGKRDQNKPTRKDGKRNDSGPMVTIRRVVSNGSGWTGKVKQSKPKAACVEGKGSPIPGLSAEQYQEFVKFFESNKPNEEGQPIANMAGNLVEEGTWVFYSGATEHISHNDAMLGNKETSDC